MKKLMFAMVAALSFAVLAQDAEGPKLGPREGGPHRGPRDRGAMMPQRGMRPTMGGMDGMVADPALMAVMNPKVAEKIGVSEEKREQIKKLDQEHREKLRDLQAKVRASMDKQANLMKESKIDEAAVMACIDELFESRKEMAKAQTKRIITVKSLFTPEELAKATEVMKEIREQHRAKRGEEGMKGPKPECKDCPKPEGDKPVPPPPPAE